MWKLLLNLALLGIPYIVAAIIDHRKLPRVRYSLREARDNTVMYKNRLYHEQRERAAQKVRRETAVNALNNLKLEQRSFISCSCAACRRIRADRHYGYMDRIIRNIKRNE